MNFPLSSESRRSPVPVGWLLAFLTLLVLAVVGNFVTSLQADQREQNTVLVDHEKRVTQLEERRQADRLQLDRIEAKLDQLTDRVSKR